MTDATRIYRALVVDAFSPATWDHWIRRTSRADGGRDPAASSDQETAVDSHHDNTHPRARDPDVPNDTAN